MRRDDPGAAREKRRRPQSGRVVQGRQRTRALRPRADGREPTDRGHRKRRLQGRIHGMTESLTAAVLLPIGLGLFGFIEPCSIGSTLVFIKVMEGKAPAVKLWQVGVFTATRALFIGLLGAVAVLAGSALIGFPQAVWARLRGGCVA